MGVTADRVVVELEAKLDRYTSRILGAAKTFERSASQIENRARQAERAVSGAFRGIAAAAGIGISVAGSLAAARAYLAIADSAKNLTAQLKLATAETGSFLTAQDDVRRIAATTRSDLEGTAKLYGNFIRNARELGITQAEAARSTEVMAKTFIISGASTVEAAQSTRQLVQALQSGVLRGDEFNTVMEAAPRFSRLLADSLGVTRGELRKMAEDGKLTAQALVSALTDEKFTAAIDAEFKMLPVTFEQAMTLIHNAAVITFGAFDRGGEFSQALINFMMGGVENMDQLEQRALDLGIETRAIFEGLNNVFDPMGKNATDVISIIRGEIIGLRNLIASLFGAMDSIRNFGLDAGAHVDNALRQGSGIDIPMPLGLPPMKLRLGPRPGQRPARSDMRERFLRGNDSFIGSQGTKTTVQSFRDQQIFGAGFAPGAEPDVAGPARVAPGAAGKKKKGRKGPSAETLAKRAEAARLLDERNEEAFQQQMLRFNDDIIAARQARASAADAVAAFEVQSIEVERQRQESAINAQVTQKRIDEAKAVQLRALNDELAREKTRNVQLAEEQRIRAERTEVASANLRNEEELTEAWGSMAETADEQRAVALRILDLQFQQERLELEAIIASEKSTAAQKAIAAERLRILGQLKGAKEAQIERDTRTPGQEYLAGLRRTQAQLDEDFQRVATSGLDAFNQGIVDAIMNGESLGATFKKVANQIISDLLRIAIQQAVIKPLANALFGGGQGGGDSGGFGALLAMAGSFFGGSGSSGGGGFALKDFSNIPGRALGGKVVPGVTYLTGESGSERIRVGQAGLVDPNHRLSADSMGGGRQGPSVIRLEVVRGEMFEAHVTGIAGDAALHVVQVAAPHLTDAAVNETARRFGRGGF